MLEKTLESLLDYKQIQPVHPKGNQSWIFIGRTDAEAETPILWPPDVKNWLMWKDSDAWKDWRWEEKGMKEDKIVGWHHWLDGHESEQAPGVGDGQGSLACCSPWGHKESDTTEQLNWTELIYVYVLSHFSSIWLLVIPWTVACQAPLSLGFCRQEYWSGLPCPPPGDLPDPGMEPASSAAPALQADSLLLSHQGYKSTVLQLKENTSLYCPVLLHHWSFCGKWGALFVLAGLFFCFLGKE